MGPVLLLALLILAAALHIFRDRGFAEASKLQITLFILYAMVEPWILRLLDKMLRSKILSGTRPGRALLKAIAKALWFLPHGIVIDHEAAVKLIKAIPDDSHIAIGPCVCKKSIGMREEPYFLDMLIMYGAEIFKKVPPEEYEYRYISKEEAIKLLQEFREHNLVHEAFACFKSKKWLSVICNCGKQYCVPTRGYLVTGEGVYPGPSTAVVDVEKCAGIEKCGVCMKVCTFNAVESSEGKSTVTKRCMGCGLCAYRCPQGARRLVPRSGYNARFLPIEHIYPSNPTQAEQSR